MFPYQETVHHPAFDNDIVNSGVLFIAKNGDPIKRQELPVFEELEIGAEDIVIRKKNKTEKHPIPKQLAVFLSVLRAIILDAPEKIDPGIEKAFDVSSNRWTATITVATGRKEKIELSGCGRVLEAIRIGAKRGQQRHLRFLSQ